MSDEIQATEFVVSLTAEEARVHDEWVRKGDSVAMALARVLDGGYGTDPAAEMVVPGRLPGELDKAAFAHMLKLRQDFRAAVEDTQAPDHFHASTVTAAFLGGAVGLYAWLTGQDTSTVQLALTKAWDS